MVNGSYIKLHEAEILNDRILVFNLSFSDNLKKIILSNQFYIKYEKPITKVDKDFLNIPGVGCLATVAWATGSELIVDTIDKQFMDANAFLSIFQNFFNEQFGNIFSTGKIKVDKLTKNRFNNKKTALNT